MNSSERGARGYFGIGVEHSKFSVNVGTLLRSAAIFGAAFVFTVGRRYKQQASDTTKAWRHMPLYHYETFADLVRALPYSAPLVGIELDDRAELVTSFEHPERCVYLLGAEDHGLTKEALAMCHRLVKLPGGFSMNVATAGSIVMFDRWQKYPAHHAQAAE